LLKAREHGAPPVSPVRRLASLVIEGGEQPRGMARVSTEGHSPPPSRSCSIEALCAGRARCPSLAASKSAPWILCGLVAAQGPGVVRSSPIGRQIRPRGMSQRYQSWHSFSHEGDRATTPPCRRTRPRSRGAGTAAPSWRGGACPSSWAAARPARPTPSRCRRSGSTRSVGLWSARR
jgi:hypothetical protein